MTNCVSIFAYYETEKILINNTQELVKSIKQKNRKKQQLLVFYFAQKKSKKYLKIFLKKY